MGQLKTGLKEFLGSKDLKQHLKVAALRVPELASLKAHLEGFLTGREAVATLRDAVTAAVEQHALVDGEECPIWGFGGPGTAQFLEALVDVADPAALDAELRRAVADGALAAPARTLRQFASFVAETAREANVGAGSNLHVGYATCFLTFLWHVHRDGAFPVFYGASHKGMKALLSSGAVEEPDYRSRDLGLRFEAFLRVTEQLEGLVRRVNPRLNLWTVEAFLDWYAAAKGPGSDSSQTMPAAGTAPSRRRRKEYGMGTLAMIDPSVVAAAIATDQEEDEVGGISGSHSFNPISPLISSPPPPRVSPPPVAGAPAPGSWYDGLIQPAEAGLVAKIEPDFDPAGIQEPELVPVKRVKLGKLSGPMTVPAAIAVPTFEPEPEVEAAAGLEPEPKAEVFAFGVDDAFAESDADLGIEEIADEEFEEALDGEEDEEGVGEFQEPGLASTAYPVPAGVLEDEDEGEDDAVPQMLGPDDATGTQPELPDPSEVGAELSPAVIEQLARETCFDAERLEELLGLLNQRHRLLIEGPTGTGKTYFAARLARAFAGSSDRVRFVGVHATLSYQDFVEKELRSTAVGSYGAEPGVFKAFCEIARRSPGFPFVLVLDDVGRADLAEVFGDCLALVDGATHEVVLPVSRTTFSLPKNVHLILTAGTEGNRSLDDPSLRRRFPIATLEPDGNVLRRFLQRISPGQGWIADLYERLNEQLSVDVGPDAQIGHTVFMRPGIADGGLGTVWAYDVMPVVQRAIRSSKDRQRYGLAGLIQGISE